LEFEPSQQAATPAISSATFLVHGPLQKPFFGSLGFFTRSASTAKTNPQTPKSALSPFKHCTNTQIALKN
jgi:hypothetical protein